jgi:hypothetical protein
MDMNIISTSMHAKLDYIVGIFFIASPWILNFTDSPAATWTLVAVGATAVLMSLFTDYEGGVVRSIPMRVHLTIDVFSGAFLASSPWLLGFAEQVFLPHLILGLFEVAVSLLTTKHAAHEKMKPVIDPNADGVNKSTSRI